MPSHPRTSPARLLAWAALAVTAASAHAQSLPPASPFLPPAANAAEVAGVKYQLGGVLGKGKDVMISVTRMSDKQSFWIPVGGTVAEITAVSYVPELDEAVISANGERLTLKLRQTPSSAGAVAGAPAAAAETVAVSAPLPPPVGGPEVQEREARMLVTDLLEIGQQHRKAYEEAKKKADAEKAAKR